MWQGLGAGGTGETPPSLSPRPQGAERLGSPRSQGASGEGTSTSTSVKGADFKKMHNVRVVS